MTEERELDGARLEELRPGRAPQGLDVPVTRVAGGRDAGRRTRLAVVGVVVFGLAVVALGLPGRTTPSVAIGSAEPSLDASERPSPTPRRSRRPVEPVAPFRIPEIVSRQLPGAPDMAIYRRDGDDMEVLAWRDSLGGLDVVDRVPGAFEGFGEDPGSTSASPNGRLVVIQRFGRAVAPGPSNARLVGMDFDGPAWEGTVSAFTTTVWSADSRRFATAISATRWTLVEIGAGGATATDLEVGGGPEPPPSPDPGGPLATPEVFPVAFSADGAWLYGGRFGEGIDVTVRIRLADGASEAIAAAPLAGRERPVGGLLADTGVGGRTITGIEGSTITVREADGSVAFEVSLGGRVTQTLWLEDGRILVSTGGDTPAESFRLLLVAPDGSVGPPVLEVPGPVAGSIFAVREDHAMVVFFAEADGPRLLLVLVRLADGRAATLEIDEREFTSVTGIGWLEEPGAAPDP